MFLWELVWIHGNGSLLQERQGLTREEADHLAERWLQERPQSRVYLYRRRGGISVLMHIWSNR